jgi:hypothetical protein
MHVFRSLMKLELAQLSHAAWECRLSLLPQPQFLLQ